MRLKGHAPTGKRKKNKEMAKLHSNEWAEFGSAQKWNRNLNTIKAIIIAQFEHRGIKGLKFFVLFFFSTHPLTHRYILHYRN
jgi:hypothetical protein